jgi:hypothetical protein
MERDYSKYLIRDQDGKTRRTLDLLQGWGLPVRESIRSRLGRALMTVGNALQRTGPVRKATQTSPSHCGLQ